MEYDFDQIEDEDSPYPEVRASVSNVDDPEMPARECLISRSRTHADVPHNSDATDVGHRTLPVCSRFGDERLLQLPQSCTYGHSPRAPVRCASQYLSPLLANAPSSLLSYPAGKLAAYALPIVTYRLLIPARLGGPIELSLNPGPWNIKEHVLVFIMSNGERGFLLLRARR
jgi:hypothetical protein